MILLDLTFAQRQILFSLWVDFREHKRMILAERRGPFGQETRVAPGCVQVGSLRGIGFTASSTPDVKPRMLRASMSLKSEVEPL